MNGGNNREEKSLRHVSMIAKFLDLIKLWSCKYCWEKKKEKIDMYHFPVYVALRIKTATRTFLPSFDNANSRLFVSDKKDYHGNLMSHVSSLLRYSQRLWQNTFALI